MVRWLGEWLGFEGKATPSLVVRGLGRILGDEGDGDGVGIFLIRFGGAEG